MARTYGLAVNYTTTLLREHVFRFAPQKNNTYFSIRDKQLKVMNVKETRGEVLDQLNKLLTSNRDAEKGYQEAAENAKDAEIKSMFLAQSRQRGEFVLELDREIRTLGGEPDSGTSLASDLHRAWINVKSTFASNDDKATVQECQRGDREALDNYNSVLQETDLIASTRELLLRQKQSIDSAHASMARLALVV